MPRRTIMLTTLLFTVPTLLAFAFSANLQSPISTLLAFAFSANPQSPISNTQYPIPDT